MDLSPNMFGKGTGKEQSKNFGERVALPTMVLPPGPQHETSHAPLHCQIVDFHYSYHADRMPSLASII